MNSLLIWLKLLYFMRIFESTGYLIRIIIQVCIDMRHFLLILLLTLIAFGEGIQAISEETTQGFTGYLGGVGYAYRMVLGDFSVDDYDTLATFYLSVLFIFSTVLNSIIMMNLLIAIISESFTNINSVAKQANYLERAKMTAENLYLVPMREREAHSQKDTYLLMAIDTQQEMDDQEESLEASLGTLKDSLKDFIKQMHLQQNKVIMKNHEEVLKALGLGSTVQPKLGAGKSTFTS